MNLNIIMTVLPLLVSVAFLTLSERAVMGSLQRRMGPAVSGAFGTLQPFWDGLKLAVKEPILPANAAAGIFYAAPLICICICVASWCTLLLTDLSIGGLFLLLLSSLAVYGVLLAGYSCNSKYAFLGCLRSVSLMISYELVISVVILCVILETRDGNGFPCLNLTETASQTKIILIPAGLLFYICSLAESKRVPFDLPEAEAELVAGYNVEYSSLGFAVFFVAEYGNTLLMAALINIYFLGKLNSALIAAIFVSFIWVRGTLPRYRYDMFMQIGWKSLLPVALALYLAQASLGY
uniref:NADH-ubiquinone oxidoreductase chain 1 n=1 Tax=Polytomella parva TaxID=51329 RepID=Q8LYV8_9CHLO|nr:NADH dehydrogenase subunit 1 [Polytomella parva]AAL65276.1 NADH dehydrogenase subunit 1 [Polytomella parva]